MNDAQPEPHAQREQSLPRCPDELAERFLNLRRQRTLQRLRGRDDLRAGYLLHGGSSCPLGPGFDRPERSQPERTRREDRHSKFYEISDNLSGWGAELTCSAMGCVRTVKETAPEAAMAALPAIAIPTHGHQPSGGAQVA